MSDVSLKPYTNIAYHNSELKSLTRYIFDKVSERAKLRVSVSRLVNILFPELEKLLPILHTALSYALLSELPSAKHIANVHLTHLTNLLYTAYKGRYGRDKAIKICDAARNSIGTFMPAKALELKHTIKLIREFDNEISEIEDAIQSIMDQIASLITSIPGIGTTMAAMIVAEIGISTTLIHLTKSLLLQVFHHPHTNPVNLITVMRTWKSVVLVICVMLYLIRPNMSVFGVLLLLTILRRSVQRGIITMLLFLMLLKS